MILIRLWEWYAQQCSLPDAWGNFCEFLRSLSCSGVVCTLQFKTDIDKKEKELFGIEIEVLQRKMKIIGKDWRGTSLPFSISAMNRIGNNYRFLQEKLMVGRRMSSVGEKRKSLDVQNDCLCQLWNGSDGELQNTNVWGLVVGPSRTVHDCLKCLPGQDLKHLFIIFIIL